MSGGATVDEGAGASLVWSTSSYTTQLVSINPSGWKRDAIDVTTLADTGKKYIRSKVIEPGQYEVTINYSPGNPPPIFGTYTQERFKLNFPLFGTQTTADSESVDGFISEVSGPPIKVGEAMQATMTIKLSGLKTTAAGG